jgi:hypothetical protein
LSKIEFNVRKIKNSIKNSGEIKVIGAQIAAISFLRSLDCGKLDLQKTVQIFLSEDAWLKRRLPNKMIV